jgi:hypothetical protein
VLAARTACQQTRSAASRVRATASPDAGQASGVDCASLRNAAALVEQTAGRVHRNELEKYTLSDAPMATLEDDGGVGG